MYIGRLLLFLISSKGPANVFVCFEATHATAEVGKCVLRYYIGILNTHRWDRSIPSRHPRALPCLLHTARRRIYQRALLRKTPRKRCKRNLLTHQELGVLKTSLSFLLCRCCQD